MPFVGDISSLMYKLMHPKCGGVSFYMTVKPKTNEPLYPQYVIYPDGHRPEVYELAICGSCGEYAQCTNENVQQVTDPEEIRMVISLLNVLSIEDE